MQVSNSYILTASNITPGMVENLSQQLLQKSRRVSSIAMGKKELTQFRTLILYDTAIHSELDPQLVGGLVALLNTLTENDNNNNDRKIFRCIVYLLMENLCLRNFSIPPEKLSIYKDAKNQFMTLLYYEISHRVGTHKVLVLRLLGMAASAFCSLTLPLSPSEKEKAYQTITQVLSTTSLPSYTRSGGEGNRDADNKTLQILGCCSALRRLGRPIPTSLLQTILNIMKINNRSIVRHSSSLLMTYVAEPAEDYDLMIVLHLLTDIMKRQVAASSVLRDDLALTYLIRASRCAFNQALQKKESQGEEGEKTLLAAYEMVHEVMSLIPTASLKTLGDIIAMYFSSVEDWDLMVKKMEDQTPQLVKQVLLAMINATNTIPPDSISFPMFCRLCESFGQFLWQRPVFSNEGGRNHKVFSVLAVNRDAEQIDMLWKILSRYYQYMTTPKQFHAGLPPIVRTAVHSTVSSTQSSSSAPSASMAASFLDPDLEKKSYWGFEDINVARSHRSIPSPYTFVCLLRALVWITPDHRYSPKNASLLWSRLNEWLLTGVDILANAATSSAEVLMGSTDLLLPQLLRSVYQRVESSLFRLQSAGKAEVADSSPALSAKAPVAGNGLSNLFMPVRASAPAPLPVVYIHYAREYLPILHNLALLVLRTTTSPEVADLMPSIWRLGRSLSEAFSQPNAATAGLGFNISLTQSSVKTTQQSHAQKREEVLVEHLVHLCEVVAVGEGALSHTKIRSNSIKLQTFLGLVESAMWHLVRGMSEAVSVWISQGDIELGQEASNELIDLLMRAGKSSRWVSSDACGQNLLDFALALSRPLERSLPKSEVPSQANELLDLVTTEDPASTRLTIAQKVIAAVYGFYFAKPVPSHGISGDNREEVIRYFFSDLAQRLHSWPTAQQKAIIAVSTLQNSKENIQNQGKPKRFDLSIGIYNSSNCILVEAPPPIAAAFAFSEEDFSVFDSKPVAPHIAAPTGKLSAETERMSSIFDLALTGQTETQTEKQTERSGAAAGSAGGFSFDDMPGADLTLLLSTGSSSAGIGGIGNANVNVKVAPPVDWDLLVPEDGFGILNATPASINANNIGGFDGGFGESFFETSRKATDGPSKSFGDSFISTTADFDIFNAPPDTTANTMASSAPKLAKQASASVPHIALPLAPPPSSTTSVAKVKGKVPADTKAKSATPALVAAGPALASTPVHVPAPAPTAAVGPVLELQSSGSMGTSASIKSTSSTAPLVAATATDFSLFESTPARSLTLSTSTATMSTKNTTAAIGPVDVPSISAKPPTKVDFNSMPVPSFLPSGAGESMGPPGGLEDIFGGPTPSSTSANVGKGSTKSSYHSAAPLIAINIAEKRSDIAPTAPSKVLPLAPPPKTSAGGAAGVAAGGARGKRQSVAALNAVFGDDLTGLVAPNPPAFVATSMSAPKDPFSQDNKVPITPASSMTAVPADPFGLPRSTPGSFSVAPDTMKPSGRATDPFGWPSAPRDPFTNSSAPPAAPTYPSFDFPAVGSSLQFPSTTAFTASTAPTAWPPVIPAALSATAPVPVAPFASVSSTPSFAFAPTANNPSAAARPPVNPFEDFS